MLGHESMSEQVAALVSGMYLRARRQLIASLHNRVAQTEGHPAGDGRPGSAG
jgi:hypothetical protein